MRKLTLVIIFLVLLSGLAASAESVPEDGLYSIGVSSSSRMFQVEECMLQVEDGRMTAVLTLSGTGYGYLYAGTAAEADAAPVEKWAPYSEDWAGRYSYAIPVEALDAETAVAGYSKRYEKWYDRTLVFFSSTLSETESVAPDGVYAGTVASDTRLDGMGVVLMVKDGVMTAALESEGVMELRIDGEDCGAQAMPVSSLDARIPVELEGAPGWIKIASDELKTHNVTVPDGVYGAEVETDSGLLRFTQCTLVVRNGKMTARMTAKNSNFDYLYLGLAAQARADEDAWIPAVTDAEGRFCYDVEIPSLDNELSLATYSAKKKMWYDREIVIRSDSLQRMAEAVDAPAAASQVSAALADGCYVPDAFIWSGGTGRVELSCPQVVIEDGRATATIVFSSPNYGYAKAGGEKYDGQRTENETTFVLPVELNAQNEIIGMTTAMSAEHEVAYSVYVGLGSGEALAGLEFVSEDETEYAELFNLRRYEGGFVRVDVEGTTDLLLVPAGSEAPAAPPGDVKAIHLPVENAYVASEAALELISGVAPDAACTSGDWKTLDYAQLLLAGCDLAILPGEFADTKGNAELSDVLARLELLGIPAFVDRSADEAGKDARLEWRRVYAEIFAGGVAEAN